MGIKYSLVALFVYLASFIFARFNLSKGEVSTYLRHCKLPILLIHGTTDDIVPVENSRQLKSEFPNLITYVEVEGAPHGMSYFVDYEKYSKELDNFLNNLSK
jgi:pimeloyl-ACP methyl ester carboxylesterase